MKSEYKLSVVFCATNESNSLIRTYFKIRKYDYAYEYIFVLSTNASAECVNTVEKLCKNSGCRYVFQREAGLGGAIRNAIEEATGTHIIIWPADDGMDTASFPEMVRLSKENPEKIVSVSRWLAHNGFAGYGKIRKAINFFSQKLFALLYKSDLTDFTNPTQIAPLSIYRSINWQGYDWSLIPELIFKPLKLGYGFIEVPCKNLKREEGKSNSDFLKLCNYYLVIFKIYFMSEDELNKRSNQ